MENVQQLLFIGLLFVACVGKLHQHSIPIYCAPIQIVMIFSNKKEQTSIMRSDEELLMFSQMALFLSDKRQRHHTNKFIQKNKLKKNNKKKS